MHLVSFIIRTRRDAWNLQSSYINLSRDTLALVFALRHLLLARDT